MFICYSGIGQGGYYEVNKSRYIETGGEFSKLSSCPLFFEPGFGYTITLNLAVMIMGPGRI